MALLPLRAGAQVFTDVPIEHWARAFIETLAAAGVTAGCGSGNYCPDASVTRAQMAVFLERGMRGGAFSPPAALGNVFLDVGASAFAAAFIEQLYADGITSGCGSNNYCPGDSVTRAQMAVFLLRAVHGQGYSPPAASGVFTDVPVNYWAGPWIEQLAVEGVTSGCGGGNFCPDALVTRAQMAVFLVRAFDLPDAPAVSSAEISPAGGSLGVTNSSGDLITVTFPPGALDEATQITLTALETPPAAPFGMDLIPGVELTPHGLVFDEPVTLTIEYAELQSNSAGALLFWAATPEVPIPLANQISTPTQISAELFHFSNVTGGFPTAEELGISAERYLMYQLADVIPDPFGWRDLRDDVEAFMSMSRMSGALGNDELETQYRDAALGLLEEGVLEFLDIAVPAAPCDLYAPVVNRMLDTVRRYLGASDGTTQLLEERLLSVDNAWCCFSLTGNWSSTEVADETACGEGVNTYYGSVSLFDANGAISASWPGGGHATVTKNQCLLSGWGGGTDDEGITYGSGSGSIAGTGTQISLFTTWQWNGIDEDTGEPLSCSGSSNITLTR